MFNGRFAHVKTGRLRAGSASVLIRTDSDDMKRTEQQTDFRRGKARQSRLVRTCCGVLIGIAGLLSLNSSADAQLGSSRLPSFNYFQGFGDFYRADYRSALRSFTSSARTAYRRGDQRFLDSACAWTMMGECHFHLGNYAEALALYDRSLALYLQYTKLKWQDRLQLPRLVQEDNVKVNRARITWYRPQRKVRVARLPDEFATLFGRLDALRAFEEGGVYDPAELRQVDVTEIMRCAALAMHRRRIIRGPICKYDPFTTELVNGLRGTVTNTSTVVGAYNGILKGIAAASLEDWSKATDRLKRSVLFEGKYDHPLGPVAYLTMADIASASGGDDVAQDLALEASYLAAIFGQFDVIEESLSTATKIHLKSDRSVFVPLQNAIGWANNRLNWLNAMLQVRLAECLVESGDGAGASRVLGQAAKLVKRESIPKTVIATRYEYVSAAAAFLNGDIDAGRSLLNAAMNQDGNGSLSRFRIELINTLSAKGSIGERQSDQLFEVLLNDPSAEEWLLDPFEAMSMLLFSRTNALERWFEIVVSRKNYTRAIDVSEKLRRYRFYANLPLAGRLLSFRWMLNASSHAISKETLTGRSNFFVRHPPYQDLVRKADQINAKLTALPVVPNPKSDEHRQQSKLLSQLADISAQQEVFISKVALLREPVRMEFPPQRDAEKWLKSVRPGQRAIVNVATADAYHCLMVSDQGVQYLSKVPRRKFKPLVNAYIKALQAADNVLEPEKLDENKWQKPARKLKETIWPRVDTTAWSDLNELVIVPDGWLWYAPVELFPVGDQEKNPPTLGDQIAIRYSPTLYTALGAQRSAVVESVNAKSVVLAGKMSARGQVELVEAQVADLEKQQPDIVNVKHLPVDSGLFSSLVNQWLVWGGLNIDRSGPLSFVPIPAGFAHGKNSSLNSWVAFPWRGPETVLMPGFQSDAGNGLKNQLEGSDLFLTTCGLMAAGTNEILVGRWNTGGDLSLKTGREYLQQRKKLSGSQALMEAKQFAKQQTITAESEPKLRLPRGTDKSTANSPVFWSSMIVVQVPNAKTAVANTPPANGAPPVGQAPAAKNGSVTKGGSAAKDGSASKDGNASSKGSAAKDGSATNGGSASKETKETDLSKGSANNGSGQKP